MPASATSAYCFAGLAGLRLAATFDGGLPWLREAQDALRICAAFFACAPD